MHIDDFIEKLEFIKSITGNVEVRGEYSVCGDVYSGKIDVQVGVHRGVKVAMIEPPRMQKWN